MEAFIQYICIQYCTIAFTCNFSQVELLAFFGLCYARGILGANLYHAKELWTPNYSPVFAATMSENRFTFLQSHISFDNEATRPARFLKDKFAAAREIFESWNFNCGRALQCGPWLSLDETLYPSRNHISFKQYNKQKPAKYGILFKSINGATVPYTFNSHVYCGKPEGPEPHPHYVKGVSETVKKMLIELGTLQELRGRNVTFDRYYTTIELVDWLLNTMKMTAIGTLQSNKRGLPAHFKAVTGRPVGDYIVLYEVGGKKSLHSWIASTKGGKKNKNVMALTTMDPLLGVTQDEVRNNPPKPAMLKIYDFSMGGTDRVDQIMSFMSTRGKSKRWTKSVMAYILDSTRVNCGTIKALRLGKDPTLQNRRAFAWDLVRDLVLPHVTRRQQKPALQIHVRKKIEIWKGKIYSMIYPTVQIYYL